MATKIEKLNGEARYGYRGWVITKEVRDWTWIRGSGGYSPKTQWRAHKRVAPKWDQHYFSTRREAVAYIDSQGETR